jgi:HAD superfamily hydrolase (TIGR01509 family)
MGLSRAHCDAGSGLVIFDCDGVLVDSDRISLRIQADALTAIGLPTSYEDCVRDYLGIGMDATLEIVEHRLGRPLPAGWLQGLDAAVTARFETELERVPGVEAALDRIAYATCVASGGTHAKMRVTLGLTGLYERFQGRIYSVEEVTRGKPAPDLFLHAAAQMNAPPERCVVVEDSPAGVAAAKAAGMPALGFAAETPSERLMQADAVFRDMRELPALIESILGARPV